VRGSDEQLRERIEDREASAQRSTSASSISCELPEIAPLRPKSLRSGFMSVSLTCSHGVLDIELFVEDAPRYTPSAVESDLLSKICVCGIEVILSGVELGSVSACMRTFTLDICNNREPCLRSLPFSHFRASAQSTLLLASESPPLQSKNLTKFSSWNFLAELAETLSSFANLAIMMA
jgi:hypothetical protein